MIHSCDKQAGLAFSPVIAEGIPNRQTFYSGATGTNYRSNKIAAGGIVPVNMVWSRASTDGPGMAANSALPSPQATVPLAVCAGSYTLTEASQDARSLAQVDHTAPAFPTL
jgi:hypothetical protein